MFNAWTIWWNADRLGQGLSGYWDAPIFHPEKGTFAFSEPQPATWLVAPIVWVTGSPIPAYQAYLVGSLVLNGVFAVRLLRALRTGWFASAIGGVAVLLHPLVHQQLDVLQLIPLWGILWTLEVLFRMRSDERARWWRNGVELGVAFAAVFLTSVHHGMFFGLLLGFTVWMMISGRNWRGWLAATGCAILTASLLLGPLLGPMSRILSRHAVARDAGMVESLSAKPGDWLQVPPRGFLHLPSPARTSFQLSPGWLRCLLGAVTLAIVWHRPAQIRTPALFLAAVAGWGLFWSCGVNLRIGSWQPWLTLTNCLPAFAHVRSVFRFAYFVQLMVILLAAVGLGQLARYRVARNDSGYRRPLLLGLFTLLAFLVAVEVPPPAVYLAGVPDVSVERPWVGYLRQHASPGSAAVCLPLAAGNRGQDFDQTARWMLYGIQHRLPLINGYSGFFPESWYQMVELLSREPFGADSLAKLDEVGVEFIVLERRRMPASAARPAPTSRFQPTRVFQDGYVEIWRLGRK
jgi:hypothetical protein